MLPSDTIAARLRRVLAEKRLTESKAAELAGLARSAVTKVLHKLEAGSESVQLDTLKKIASGIGVFDVHGVLTPTGKNHTGS